MNLFSILLLLSFITPLWSDDLGEFKENVEKEEEENSQKEETNKSDDSEKENEADSPFLRFLWEITFLLWFIHNETVYYTAYPYESSAMNMGDNFIGHDLRSEEELYADKLTTKDYNFAFYGGGSINEGLNTFGGMFRLTGKFVNHFGPEIDYRILWNGQNLLHNLSGGLNLSFFQFNYLSLDFYFKAAFFMGLLERQGVSLGAKLTSYPIKPLSLEIRSGAMIFQSITFVEFEIKLGFHAGPVEIFGDFYTLQSTQSQLYSFGVGAGYHF